MLISRRSVFSRVAGFMAAATFALASAPALASDAVPLGDDGLHKPAWLVETFRDMRDDLEEARADGRRMVLLIEQRGCIYCTRMHEEVFIDPEITRMLSEDYFVVQVNMFGDIPITDLDGVELSEREMIRRWNVMFTPTMIFLPEELPESGTVVDNASAILPGGFGIPTTQLLLTWVLERGYEGEEHFQQYVARHMNAQN